jgi:predicted HTH transcriptional regulator
MNDSELESLLNDLESDRVERKASISDRDKIRQTICAFANDYPNHQKPGVLFIGINDNGSCTNLPITDELLLTLSDWKSNGNILPFPSMVVQKRNIHGCELAVVIIEPSDDPPVRYRGRVWIRVGPRTETATAEEEQRLAEKRRFKNIPFDIRPISSATLADLDENLFVRFFALQQLARNAIMHRTYEWTNAPVRITWFSDRIEIQNPGGPFGQVNRANFGRPGITDYRNPHLAEAMKNLGYVQRFGVGILLARQALEKNGNPPPEFTVEEAHLLVTLRKRP